MNQPPREYAGALSGVVRRLLSVPIALRILGLGVLVTAIFAGVTLYNVRGGVSHALYGLLEEKARYMAHSAVSRVEEPMIVGDTFAVHRAIQSAVDRSPDVRYILVQDSRARVVGHTFPRGVPRGLMAAGPADLGQGGTLQVLGSPEGLIFEATAPISGGQAGSVRLGVDDRMVKRELGAITRSVLWALALCAVMGLGFGVALTYSIAQPLHHLVRVTDRIRQGDFEVAAEVHSGDELGRLATAFNRMTEALQTYRRAVQEEEAARLALIDRIVSGQEDERKRIARELHDEFGHGLSVLLLNIQPTSSADDIPESVRTKLEDQIRALIDEVRGLAWQMRPSILDDYGLDSALARYAEHTSQRAGLPVDYQSTGLSSGGRLPGDVEVCLYRIAQEAVTNVLRHAQASQASIVLLQRAGEATLIIEDDGVGFDEGSIVSRKRCLGLMGMRERAALAGGEVVIESAPGEGTTIRVRIRVSEG